MNLNELIINITKQVTGLENITSETLLLGDQSLIDSLSIIEILVKIESFANENNLNFSWTMDNAMTGNPDSFNTIADLANALKQQNNL